MNSIETNNPLEDKKWCAFHIYLPHSRFNDYLCNVVRPVISDHSLEDDFFFLRYWQGGSHIRVRFRVGKAHPMLPERLADHFRQGVPTFTETEQREYANAIALQADLAKLENETIITPRPLGLVEHMPYIPEMTKYGGETGVAIAEQVFCSTSLQVIQILAERHRTSTSPATFLPLGESAYVAAMFLAGSGVGVSEAIKFLKQYENWWSRYTTPEYRATWPQTLEYVAENLKILCTRAWVVKPKDDPFFSLSKQIVSSLQDNISEPAISLRVGDRSFLSCLSNYIHTTNNRLGLVPAGEALMAYLLWNALSDSAI